MGESDGGVLFWMVSLDNKMDEKEAKVRTVGSLDTAGVATIRESSHFSQVLISSAQVSSWPMADLKQKILVSALSSQIRVL